MNYIKQQEIDCIRPANVPICFLDSAQDNVNRIIPRLLRCWLIRKATSKIRIKGCHIHFPPFYIISSFIYLFRQSPRALRQKIVSNHVTSKWEKSHSTFNKRFSRALFFYIACVSLNLWPRNNHQSLERLRDTGELYSSIKWNWLWQFDDGYRLWFFFSMEERVWDYKAILMDKHS